MIDTLLLQGVWIMAIIAGSFQSRDRARRLPLLTLLVSAFLAACLALQFADPEILLVMQRSASAILAGQWWRMGTALFFQDGWLAGGLSNIAALLVIGGLAEQVLTRWTWIGIYALGGLAAETIALAWQPIGAGNSIAICALAGVLLVAPSLDRRRWPPDFRHALSGSGAMRVLAASAVLILLVRQDIHGAGALAGALLAIMVA
ncbi:rhomboid family intramembrane serine protease [Devosia algicola]|uniref:Rhomboid family intramembrane serine protease n=1 Tax=Devosia algicola TaxID=3026418 RepID=A0ABY7YL21_9HYPH|nr:rhomboid family intramembrane serine protease [Devosia algicola]WDR01927.1 rhomboid family intramembrane serine protease [Devosia algicola]